jgi:hypothetical protein
MQDPEDIVKAEELSLMTYLNYLRQKANELGRVPETIPVNVPSRDGKKISSPKFPRLSFQHYFSVKC